MKDYCKPLIKEESIEVSDIVANSNNRDPYKATAGAWITVIIFAIITILFVIYGILDIVQSVH